MNSNDVERIIRLALPDAGTEADQTAKSIVNLAVSYVGRMKNVDFNRTWQTFNFVSGKATYRLGVDIFAKLSDVMNAGELHSTDNVQPITLMSLQNFRLITGGLTANGRPTHATIHSADKQLEVYPTPDSNYEYGLYVQQVITKFKNIPEAYHDVVVSTALMFVQGLRDGQTLAALVREGLKDMQGDSILGWSGSTIRASRGLDGGGSMGPDSQNLRDSI